MKHTKLDWSKPLQTTDGVKAELVYTSTAKVPYPRLILFEAGVFEKWFTEDGKEWINSKGIQIINTPDPKLVEFCCNYYNDGSAHSVLTPGRADEISKHRTNRIDFSMQLEPGKNYEVTGVKEVQ